jgi:leucyl-tRNA synthetase
MSAQYNPAAIEKKWQQFWRARQTFAPQEDSKKPKFYALDMFPYPSGAGLHVGHPLGYIATDIIARYKRLKGYNVLHPMGFDAFGLPAEQYAIQTGTHPAVTTANNIKRYKEQLGILGLAYSHPEAEWSETADPQYYKWTQWIFLKIFNSWYNPRTEKAEPIETLEKILVSEGHAGQLRGYDAAPRCTAQEWQQLNADQRYRFTLHFRLAYNSIDMVNWCPALGTVLSNDEVKDGLSERGGYPVERREMRQWSMRITAYADRLLKGLDGIDWPESIKEQQRNWIGRSEGAEVNFFVTDDNKAAAGQAIKIFTTRPDTIYGATFLVLAPEHPLAEALGTGQHKAAYDAYRTQAANRSERERQMEKTVSGAFSGSYAHNPFTGKRIPIWVADYVLAGYGTGAIMAVPGHDSRDYKFAKHFGLDIVEVVAGGDLSKEAYEDNQDGVLVNSDTLNGLKVPQAITRIIQEIEKKSIGKGKITYRMRDAIFARQRYWGEPIPVAYKNGVPYAFDEKDLPVVLPPVERYQPTGSGDGPLAALTDWVNLPDGSMRETNTMPGWAGSSWYFFRYADNRNAETFADPEKVKYWLPVDLYVGGSEHAVGHLLYSRFWTKILHDLGYVNVDEPFKKLVNQGHIQGRSNFVYVIKFSNNTKVKEYRILVSKGEYDHLVSQGIKGQALWDYLRSNNSKAISEYGYSITKERTVGENYSIQEPMVRHVDVSVVENDILNIDKFKELYKDYSNAEFILEDGKYICGWEIEKMSKSKFNVVNPDDLCREYGADTFRLYEMFLGPLELSKPWNTNGITGVYNFLKKVWRLYLDDNGNLSVTTEAPTPEELKLLHQTIKKVQDDCEALSFNTSVPQFMILTNELTRLKCRKRAILEPFAVLLAPYAPHLAEELWQLMGHGTTIFNAPFPVLNESYLVESSFEYPVSVNGKLRAKITLPLDMPTADVERQVRSLEELSKYVQDKPIKKVIVVPGKIVNVVV